jgi:hypothetical protein
MMGQRVAVFALLIAAATPVPLTHLAASPAKAYTAGVLKSASYPIR